MTSLLKKIIIKIKIVINLSVPAPKPGQNPVILAFGPALFISSAFRAFFALVICNPSITAWPKAFIHSTRSVRSIYIIYIL